MKNRYFAYFLLILLSACSGKQPDTTVLNGEIKGLGNDTIYIYGVNGMYNRIDTLLVKDDKFSASLTPDTSTIARILFSNGTQYPLFINKGNKIQIKGSATELDNLEISGSTPNEEFTAFQKDLKGLGKPSDKVLEEKAKTFIKSHYASLVSIYLLDKYFVQKNNPDYTQIKELTEHMTGELKDQPYIDELLKNIQEQEKTSIGRIAPYFYLKNTKGKSINRSDFKGQYVLMHFWASWDTLSRGQNAVFRRIYKDEQKNKNFALVGISLDMNQEKWLSAIKVDSLKWEQTCDFTGWNAEIVKLFSVQTLPTNILLSPSGNIEGRNLSEEAIKNKLKEIEQQEKAKKNAKKKTGKN